MKILFFSPFSGIWEHSIPESYLAYSFAAAGHEVVFASCGGCLNSCQVLECRVSRPSVTPIQINRICKSCINLSNKITSFVPAKRMEMSRFITDTIVTDFIGDALDNSKGRELDLLIDGVPFGRIVMYDIILKFKKQNTLIENDFERKSFCVQVHNSVRSYLFAKNYLGGENFDRVVIYSPQYSTNQPVASFFINRGIPVYFIEAGTNIHKRLSTLRCWKWDYSFLVNPLLSVSASDLERLRFTQEDLSYVTKHYLRLLDAKSHMVYSAERSKAFDFQKIYPGAKGKKVILATMSSFDEAFSAWVCGLFPEKKARGNVFADQIEWISQLINFVENHSEYFLIVRVHPRDFPNKRESGLSDQGKKLSRTFEKIPPNVTINMPFDEISIYDLLGHVDLLTTGWSVTALEAGFLGVPVVTYDENMPSYPKTLMLTGSTREKYWENLAAGMEIGWSFNQIVSSINWLSLNHNYGALKISENFDVVELSPSFFAKAVRRLKTLFWLEDNAGKFLNLANVKHDNLTVIRRLIEQTKNSLLEMSEVRDSLFAETRSDDLSQYKTEMRNLIEAAYGNSDERLPPNFERIKSYVN